MNKSDNIFPEQIPQEEFNDWENTQSTESSRQVFINEIAQRSNSLTEDEIKVRIKYN